jgi:ribosomal protein L37AE/L43A
MAKIICPLCGEKTEDAESGMGYIQCENCGKTFSSNAFKKIIKWLCGMK